MFEWLDKIGAREYLEPLFGVIDVEGDGKREIFSTMRNAGTGSWDLTVLVYDTSTSRSFSAGISGGRGIFTTEPEFEGSFEAKPLVKRWLAEKINSYTGRKERSSTNIEDVWDAIHDWQRNNGRDFTLGKIVTTETRLFELHWSSICEIVDGNINWLWLLDGPLLMENKATRRRSVLYVPGDGNMAYRHNVRMISGRDYLWLEFRVQDKIVAINKKQLIAKGFRVAQWKNYANKPYDKSLDEKEVTFDLGYREGHLYDGESILTILDDLDMRQEFTGAVQCPSIGENSPIVLR
jgi:hypothetical protein